MTNKDPQVLFLTPVYNGEAYLKECIESVIRQTYQNWKYIIINNCSTDNTHALAVSYAEKDERITVVNTSELLPVIENHNFAFSHVSDESDYCKLVQADDWLFPECVERMVDLAVTDPEIGVVGGYSLAGAFVKCDGLQFSESVLPGREIARRTLLRKTYPFWSPTSTLIRGDIIRGRTPFYSPSGLHGDVEAMYEVLGDCKFGFVHQVSTFIRTHEDSETSKSTKPMNATLWSNLDLLKRYSPRYLNEAEYSRALNNYLDRYYKFLADSLLEGRNKKFWDFHREGLKSLGYPLNYFRLMGGAFFALLCRSRKSFRALYRRFRSE